jgi:hypothetical protein
MTGSRGQRAFMACMVVCVWVASLGCSCGTFLGSSSEPEDESAAVLASPTPSPSQVPSPSPSPTSRPTAVIRTSPTTESTPRPDSLLSIPAESDKDFVLEATEEELNRSLAGRTFEEQGMAVSDVRIVLTAREVSCTFRARHSELGLHTGLTIRGTPRVVNGVAYFEVNDVALDRSLSGLGRLIARAAIEEAIEGYSTDHGIPIPSEHVHIREIQITDGAIRVTGRTR